MENKFKTLKNSIILLLLIALTSIIIFNNHNLNQIINIILNANYFYIILAIICMLIRIICESLNLRNLLNSLGEKVSLIRCIKYTFIGFFYSGITPAATGGQPMEIYYMHKEKIRVTHSTLALLVELCAYHIVSIILGIIGGITNHKLLSDGFIWIFIIGITINIIATTTMLIGLFSKKLSKKIVSLFLKLLNKLKIKNIDIINDKINDTLEEYHEGARFIKQNKNLFIKSLIIVTFHIVAYYSIPYCIYKSLGLSSYNYFQMLFIQAMLYISISSMPLPGTVGINETMFLKVYSTIFTGDLLLSAMLLNRGISFYLFMIISLIIVIISTIIINKKSKKIIENALN